MLHTGDMAFSARHRVTIGYDRARRERYLVVLLRQASRNAVSS